ncbi:MAG TPA: MopE-related protein [Kofleriaceae bacterium]
MTKWTSLLLCCLAACGSSPSGSECEDADQDGVTTCDGDCDDGDPLSLPGGNEICGDATDNNCDGQDDEGCNGLGTFVSSLTGDDANPGTKAAPVKTIAAGMANAALIGGSQSVIVAEGTYAEKVTLAEGVDLLGGFQCDTASCGWQREISKYASTIANQDFDGVVASTGVTQATLVEGMSIVGMDGVPPAAPGSCAMQLAGGSPTLRGNKLTGGTVTGGGFAADRSIGLILRSTTDPAGAIIDHNELIGGTSSGVSAGLMVDSYPARTPALAAVLGNVIVGGAGRRSAGVIAWNSMAGTVLSNNDIMAGNSNGGASSGIEVGSTMAIDSNRINVDQATVGTCMNAQQWCTGITSQSSTTTITNNIVFGAKSARSAAVFLGEFEVPAGAVVLNGNTLNGGGIGAVSSLQSQSAALVVAIGPCNTCGFNGFVGRVRNNILDGGSNQLRFGVREDPAAGRMMRPELLENNLFWFAPTNGRADVLYRQVDAQGVPKDHTTLATLNILTSPPASANLHADPMLDATWHVPDGSPCIDNGTATEAPPIDFDGEARPMRSALDIGHDELQ